MYYKSEVIPLQHIFPLRILFSIGLVIFLFGCDVKLNDGFKIQSTSCEFKSNPLGVNTLKPRFGWILSSNERNQMQSAYRILVSDELELLHSDNGNIWDTERMESVNSINVAYGGLPLISGKKYYWKVKVWNQSGNESGWSEPSYWRMGLLGEDDWRGAKWIGYEELPDSLRLVPGNHGSQDHLGSKAMKRPVTPLFRKDFLIEKPIENAALFISGLGEYETYINGDKVGNRFLSPGWTFYDKSVLYNVFDVKEMLHEGSNAIGAIVGNGFHNINRERYFKINITFGMPKILALLNITYTDGTVETIVTDSNWKTAPSPVTFNSVFGGEDYDARLEQPKWNKSGFDDSNWKSSLDVDPPKGKLFAETDYPLKAMEELSPVDIIRIDSVKYLYDFGQNASGIIRLTVNGTEGQQVKLIPGELIDSTNSVIQSVDISGAPYFFDYTLKGEGIETWEPRFTYYGFRYVQVEGAIPGNFSTAEELPELVDLKMLHTRNSSPEVGSFESSSELMNQINSMIKWSIRSNMASVLTDCPHREKLGWLEVTHLMGDAIHFNYDIRNFYTKIVDDMIEAQTPEGLVPTIAPEYAPMDNGFGDYRDAPVWGSASIVLPWLIYKWYGDSSVMNKAWPMMTKYAAYLRNKSRNYIISHGLGDWCELNPNPTGPRLTPTSFMGTAQFYYDLKLLASMAQILKKEDDQKLFLNWSEEVKVAFDLQYFDKETCTYSTGSQAAQSFPLAIGLVSDKYKDCVFEQLIKSIERDGNKMTVGSAGMRYLVEVLMDQGASQKLFDINNTYNAGYGIQLLAGATTLVEPWIPSKVHGSNNHPALGNLMRWFYEGLSGIYQEEESVAYKEIVIQPQFVNGVEKANSSFLSPYGLITSKWVQDAETIELDIEIPVNTTARIIFPINDEDKIKEGGLLIKSNSFIQSIDEASGKVVCRVGSGNYSFKIKK